MAQSGRRARLAMEQLDSEGVRGVFAWQQLQRDRSMKPEIFGTIDHTHPSGAEPVEDLIVTELTTD
jgi:hypothetical protein